MTSPLSEANPASLEELFSTSPLERTPEELKVIVETLRAKRALWAQEELAGKKSSSTTKKAPKAAPAEISLDDLDFS